MINFLLFMSAVVLKASISNRSVGGEVDPDVSVRSWGDADSLVFWGFIPFESRSATTKNMP